MVESQIDIIFKKVHSRTYKIFHTMAYVDLYCVTMYYAQCSSLLLARPFVWSKIGVLWVSISYLQSVAMLLIRSYVIIRSSIWGNIESSSSKRCKYGSRQSPKNHISPQSYIYFIWAQIDTELFWTLTAHRFAAPWTGRIHSTMFEWSNILLLYDF